MLTESPRFAVSTSTLDFIILVIFALKFEGRTFISVPIENLPPTRVPKNPL